MTDLAYLQCDTEDCDHVETHPSITADLIGKTCPKCGANLLTSEDYQGFMTATTYVDSFNKAATMSGEETRDILVRIHYHDGKLSLSELK